jgi:CRP-like cAMP-binding protein
MKATVEQLAEIWIFAALNRTELERLQARTEIRTYRQGEAVMREGDRIPEKLYTLLSGSLRVAKTSLAGKETILRTLSPGDIFAAPALLGNAIAPAAVTAVTGVRVLTTDREVLLAAIADNRVGLEKRFPYYQIARSIGITYEECVRLFKKLNLVVSYRRGGKITVLYQFSKMLLQY